MRIGVAVAFSLLAGAPANASSEIDQALARLEGTLSVKAFPYRTGGNLVGCTLIYETIVQDWAYRQGQYLKVTGNVGIMLIGENLGSTLKVVVQEIDASGAKPRFIPSPPSRAYIVGKDFSTNFATLVQASASDTPGALFSIFQIEPTFTMVMSALEANEVTIAFNSANGDTDMEVRVELDVVDTSTEGHRARSESQKTDFLSCLKKLMDT